MENKNNRSDADIELDEEIKKWKENLTKPLTQAENPRMSQLEIDAINVLEKRVSINDFSKEYQQQIKDFYRFHPVNTGSSNFSASQAGRGFWK